MKLVIIQAIGSVLIAIGGLLAKGGGRRRLLGWLILSIGAITFITTSAMIVEERRETEINLFRRLEQLQQQKEEMIKLNKKIDDLFYELGKKAMEAPKLKVAIPVPVPTGKITITSPRDGDSVAARSFVEGTVSDPQSKLWVVIHPMKVSSFWVQPDVSVKEDGAWKVMAYFGRAADKGEHFEVIAIANPKKQLKEGEILDGWPEAQWSSKAVEVTRK